MSIAIPDRPVQNPGLWYQDELENADWCPTLPPEQVDELLAATHRAVAVGLQAPHFTRRDFPLPRSAAWLQQHLEMLENGRGFVVLRGLDIGSLSQAEAEILFWGIGTHLGVAVPINADGALVGHVKDLGFDINKPTVRNYQTTQELSFHNDSCDVLGLMCLQQAKHGGDSAIASAVAIHNHILDTRPDLLAELYRPIPIDRRGEAGWPEEGDAPWFALPVFSWHHDKLIARYTVHEYYYESQKFDDAPRISELQREALEYLKTTATDTRFRVNFRLQPGDIQLVNNYCVLHSRTTFEDYPEPARKRHLLRLWLAVSNSRELPEVFAGRYRRCEAGALRGGIAPRKQDTAA